MEDSISVSYIIIKIITIIAQNSSYYIECLHDDTSPHFMSQFLGSIGGPAAILAQNCIKKVEVLEYPELGMEAIWKIDVQDFPAFIVVDDKGNDFFSKWIP